MYKCVPYCELCTLYCGACHWRWSDCKIGCRPGAVVHMCTKMAAVGGDVLFENALRSGCCCGWSMLCCVWGKQSDVGRSWGRFASGNLWLPGLPLTNSACPLLRSVLAWSMQGMRRLLGMACICVASGGSWHAVVGLVLDARAGKRGACRLCQCTVLCLIATCGSAPSYGARKCIVS